MVTVTARVDTSNFESGDGESTVTTHVRFMESTGMVLSTTVVGAAREGSLVCADLVSDELLLASADGALTVATTGCYESLGPEPGNCVRLRRSCNADGTALLAIGTTSVTLSALSAR